MFLLLKKISLNFSKANVMLLKLIHQIFHFKIANKTKVELAALVQALIKF